MSSTAPKKSLLTFSQVCSILKACGESRVAELKFGDLHVTFHPPVKEGPEAQQYFPTTPTPPEAEISDQQREQLEKHALAEDERRVKEEQLQQMLIEDPAGYERLLAEGELEQDEETGTVDGETDDRPT